MEDSIEKLFAMAYPNSSPLEAKTDEISMSKFANSAQCQGRQVLPKCADIAPTAGVVEDFMAVRPLPSILESIP